MNIPTDPTVYDSPPENCSNRESDVYNLLTQLGIVYYRVSHEPAMTIADCTEINSALGVCMCKNLLLCDRTRSYDRMRSCDQTRSCDSLQSQYYLVMLPGERMFRSAVLSRAIGVPRLSFAPAEVLEPLLGTAPGSLTVLGLKNDRDLRVRLIIDHELAVSEYIGCHPCVNTSSLKLKTSDLLHVYLPYTRHKPEIVDLNL